MRGIFLPSSLENFQPSSLPSTKSTSLYFRDLKYVTAFQQRSPTQGVGFDQCRIRTTVLKVVSRA